MLRLAKYRRKNKLPGWGVFEAADPASIRTRALADRLFESARTSLKEQHPSPDDTSAVTPTIGCTAALSCLAVRPSLICSDSWFRATHEAPGKSIPIIEPRRPSRVLSEVILVCGPGLFSSGTAFYAR
jgi:hypothetical protein